MKVSRYLKEKKLTTKERDLDNAKIDFYGATRDDQHIRGSHHDKLYEARHAERRDRSQEKLLINQYKSGGDGDARTQTKKNNLQIKTNSQAAQIQPSSGLKKDLQTDIDHKSKRHTPLIDQAFESMDK